MTVMESLVQVTVVAGPPVEIQVRVSWSGSNITSPDIVIAPGKRTAIHKSKFTKWKKSFP